MAVSRWCRALSAAPDRRHSPALDDAGLDDEQVEEEELEWRLLPRPTARIHSRHICQPAPRREGGGGGRSVSIGHFGAIKIRWPTVDCQLRISRGLDTRGATHATGHLEPKDCNELTTVALLVALSPCLSRRCLIFSARPRTDTRSRRTEPRRGCGWSPLPCLSVALYQKEAGIIGSLVPLPSTQRHLTPPNTAKHSLAVDAGLAATSTIHMDCLAPRCCAALLASPCRVPLSDAERRSGSGGTSPLECPSGQTLAPGPHGWLRWLSGLLAHAFPAMLVWKPFHSLILDLFFCKTSLCNHSAASPS